jgi:hypothetical protein
LVRVDLWPVDAAETRGKLPAYDRAASVRRVAAAFRDPFE